MHYIIGIDEVGRGSLAGPVCVAAVCMPHGSRVMGHGLGKLKDSKKLSAKQRERWFEFFKNHPHVDYAIARVYSRQIEKLNISRAANLAALRAHNRLNSKFKILNSKTYLDGGLYLGNGRKFSSLRATMGSAAISADTRKKSPRLSALCRRLSAVTVVRGDEKIKAIAVASIIAKVTRDKQMIHLAKKYPAYGFEVHKGYGTKKHLAAIKRYGASEVHRKTFIASLTRVGHRR